MDWDLAGAGGRRHPALLSELVTADRPTEPEGDLALRLGTVPRGEHEGLLRAFLREEVRSVLRLDALPAEDVGFFDLGMDSLTAVDLRGRVNRALAGSTVAAATVAFDHPTVEKLARHLAEELGAASPATPAQPAARFAPEERIAVVGLGCRFPGGESPGAFWSQLAAGGDAVRRGRPDDLMLHVPGTEEKPWGAYVEGLDRFDAGFFRIAPLEAESMDPQQRLLLEVSWEALEDAGLDPARLEGSRGGVYMGIGSNDYQRFLSGTEIHLYGTTGTSFATAIGRVAFVLGLEGPALAVDTACSSSLVAIHQAVSGLSRGEADFALAGGVNALLMTGAAEALGSAGVLSEDGRCKTFDARADGYVRRRGLRGGGAEAAVGCGAGWGPDPGGDPGFGGEPRRGERGPDSSERAGAGAGDPGGACPAGVEPGSVDYLEAHGTGTELGDPIEVRAAASVYGPGREAERPLLLGSVKTNVGHLEAAAGVAGLIKVLLSMRAGEIPKHLHFETPNPRIPWEELPVRVTAEGSAWPEGLDRPWRAGVSSFGISGTNAHVVLEGMERRSPPVLPASSPGQFSRWGRGGVRHRDPMERRSPDRHRDPMERRSPDRHRDPHSLGELPGPAPPPPEIAGPPPGELVESGAPATRLLPLSGRSGAALAELAGRYAAWLEEGEEEPDRERLSDMAWTAGSAGATSGFGRARLRGRGGARGTARAAGFRRVAGGGSCRCRGRGSESGVPVHRQGSQWRGWAATSTGRSRCSGRFWTVARRRSRRSGESRCWR